MRKPGFCIALCATCLAFVVVLLGAYTRLTHAGLGCPDWPGCYGFIYVPQTEEQLAHAMLRFPDAPVEADKGWSEMIHRYFAGGLSVLVVLLALQAIKRRRQPGQPLGLPLLLLGVLVAQALFGMWTVTLKLWPHVVTGHLLGGFITLSLLFLLSLRLSGRAPAVPSSWRLRLLARAGLVLVMLQVALGGWVSSNYASVACLDLPTCNGVWWPAMDFDNGFHLSQQIGPNYLGGHLHSEARTAIHFTHRLGALVVGVAVALLAWQLFRRGYSVLAGLVLALLILQVSLGMGNILLRMPLMMAVAHNGGGALLFLSLVLVNYRLRAVPHTSAANAFDLPSFLSLSPSIWRRGWNFTIGAVSKGARVVSLLQARR
ncbi:cytochrome c oxidase assembly protein subunit 15 [Pseudomonas duriflava]|uniref:Cytochrome c oxidase assembly protein subunit 15 n=1 Tax=Pseudomonas duriflava TaxID=459528 RepID=A0A562PXY0_9PSED|nr:COX15/CtaA family protein [Pseudomonas duriflava]TWI49248.1 cytochrome c oxidase assembly protein subunit 15 [Pseudomonas duriflava]